MEAEMTTLAVTKTDRGIYRITYDGRIMGDDKGFSSLAECEAEIDKRIAIDARDAIRYDRPILLTKAV